MSKTKSKIDPAKLAAMSKEDKLKLYDLIQKKKELAKEKREGFKPNSAQLPVVMDEHRIRFFAGGNGSGKTTLLTNEHIWMAEGYHPIKKVYTKVPATIAVVVDNPIKIKDVHLKELSKWYNIVNLEIIKNGKPYPNEIIWPNGSRTVYYTHDQEPLVYESGEHDYILIDEPCPEHIFIALSRGQRTKNSNPKTFIVGTPLAQSWLRTKIWEVWERGENPDISCHRGSTEQNKENLAAGYLDSFSRLLSEDEKRVRLNGEFWDIGGLALAHLLKPEIHYIEEFDIPRDWPVIVAIDPHPQKNHVAVCLAIDPRAGYKYIIKELSAKALAKDFAMMLLEMTRGLRVIDWVSDSLGAAEMTGGDGFKSFIQVLNDCGIRVRSTTYEEKDDTLWIERIRNALAIPQESDNYGNQLPQLRIFKDCERTINDFRNVAWLKFKANQENKAKLDISNKDFLATVKYALAAATGIKPNGQQAKPVRLGGSRSSHVSIRNRYMNRG